MFSPSRVRVLNRIGQEEQVYDAGGVVFEKRSYGWFQSLVGFGTPLELAKDIKGLQRRLLELEGLVRDCNTFAATKCSPRRWLDRNPGRWCGITP